MSFSVEAIAFFKREAKRLKKKFPSLKGELDALGELLATSPATGTPIGRDCYKIRLSIKSKGKGKSGGARIITHVHVTESTVYLLSIYDKSELENLSDTELQALLHLLEDGTE